MLNVKMLNVECWNACVPINVNVTYAYYATSEQWIFHIGHSLVLGDKLNMNNTRCYQCWWILKGQWDNCEYKLKAFL